MLTMTLVSGAMAANPAEVEAWLPQLTDAVERGDATWLRPVFAEYLARVPGLTVAQLREDLRREMDGEPEVECRGALCRVRFVRSTDTSQLVLQQVDGAWRLWDEDYGGHVDGPVSARVAVDGPGEIEVRINGRPTFLFDAVTSDSSAVLDRYLAPGINLVTVVPRGQVAVSMQIERGPRELASLETAPRAAQSLTFTVDEGPRPLP